MDSFVKHLKYNLDLNNFVILKTTNDRAIIFKIYNKYTKCIYINMIDESIEISVDKVFDEKRIYKGIERLIIGKKIFNNYNDSLNYIKKNIAI
ncbi:MAG: hypothetical protein ACRC92_10175 [Peptostreptococcaceae bacterium]